MFDTSTGISIHALREESDTPKNGPIKYHTIFQSTLSVRRATGSKSDHYISTAFQSTLSVRRATGLWVGKALNW